MAAAVIRVALAAAVLGSVAGPWLLRDDQLGLLTEFYTMLVLAIMWNLLAGYADIPTVGQHGFVGVGAYGFVGFAALAGLNPFLAIPLAGFAAFVVAVPAMLIVFRLRTAYLSIGTWVVAEVLMLAAGKIEAFGGGSGESVPIAILRAFGTTRFSAAFNDLLARVGAGPRQFRGDLFPAALPDRARPDGDARQ